MADGDRIAPVTYLFRLPSPSADPNPTGPTNADAAEADPAWAEPHPAAPAWAAAIDAATVTPERPELPESTADALGRGRREVRAENVSMNALARRGMSRWELENTLRARELDDEIIADELDRLERVGLIDDASLAETLVRTQHERKGLGRSALTAELRRRHIDQAAIDAALEQVDDDDEQAKATELALKRAPQLHSFDLETAKRRLTGFLMRKGYGSSIVRTAVDEALAGRAPGRGSTVRFR